MSVWKHALVQLTHGPRKSQPIENHQELIDFERFGPRQRNCISAIIYLLIETLSSGITTSSLESSYYIYFIPIERKFMWHVWFFFRKLPSVNINKYFHRHTFLKLNCISCELRFFLNYKLLCKKQLDIWGWTKRDYSDIRKCMGLNRNQVE